MASSIQILRSSTAKERPFPGNLLDGQPAINTNAGEPGLFFKATDGSIVKIGPAAITSDGNPPNIGGTGQPGNTIGELWLDKSQPIPMLKVYDGVQWVDIVAAAAVADGSITEAKLANSAVTSAKIANGSIVNADVSNNANIAASKLSFIQSGDNTTERTVQVKLQEVDNPEVIDFNRNPLYQLASSYLGAAATWAFAHTGQSLAEGGVGGDLVDGLTPYPNDVLMLTSGPVGLNTGTLGGGIITLSEKNRVTIASSYMRNTRAFVSGASNEVVFHGQAWGGRNYNSLKKGGASGVYEKVIAQAQAVKASRTGAIYKTISVIHGEQDGLDNNTNYAANLNEWKTNFNTDLKAVTGQTENILLLLCQVGSSSGYNKIGGITSTDFPSQLEQLKAHKTYADIYLVCPKYQLAYFDHSHITNNAQRILGEYYAKAFKRIVEIGSWEPLRPVSVTGSGNQVVISFVGRVGNLVFDTTAVQASLNQGFAYNDEAGRAITGVQIVTNQVVITLSGTIGANPVVAYAYNNGAGGSANQIAGLGARGNLRDSDNAVSSFNGAPLYNWCVIFKEAVT